MQLLSLLLYGCVDDNGSFFPSVMITWTLFWIIALIDMRMRPVPRQAELVAIRYGPLGLSIVVFAFGQCV